jgi:hypothetical protein
MRRLCFAPVLTIGASVQAPFPYRLYPYLSVAAGFDAPARGSASNIASERIAMTILSVRSGSTRFRFHAPLLNFVWQLPRRAGRALLLALHESRTRAAARVFREYAHLNAANQGVAERRSAPRQ